MENEDKFLFVKSCNIIENLFDYLLCTNSRLDKINIVNEFKKNYSMYIDDMNFCFEVLAGKHKLGFTFINNNIYHKEENTSIDYNITIREFYEKYLKNLSSKYTDVLYASDIIPIENKTFISLLFNRDYKLGYSNQEEMKTNLSPMLAKRYPETVHEQCYYIQEKLDGNRCIAYFDKISNSWKFQSRSGKPLSVNFDMSWASTDLIFDGEIMTLGHAGSRDFNKTSGSINSKYLDKSQLHYYIYDIIDDSMIYTDRYKILMQYYNNSGNNCSILQVLDKIPVYVNAEYNWLLDEWLDKITSKGGEGIILRDPNAVYQHKRTDALIKYKKVKTMDLRIIDFNWGSGKYENAIGSFICEDDDHTFLVNVSGMSDDIRFSDPAQYMGKIIEVAYFDISQSKNKDTYSLRFPRLKCFRDDKTTTSIY